MSRLTSHLSGVTYALDSDTCGRAIPTLVVDLALSRAGCGSLPSRIGLPSTGAIAWKSGAHDSCSDGPDEHLTLPRMGTWLPSVIRTDDATRGPGICGSCVDASKTGLSAESQMPLSTYQAPDPLRKQPSGSSSGRTTQVALDVAGTCPICACWNALG